MNMLFSFLAVEISKLPWAGENIKRPPKEKYDHFSSTIFLEFALYSREGAGWKEEG